MAILLPHRRSPGRRDRRETIRRGLTFTIDTCQTAVALCPSSPWMALHRRQTGVRPQSLVFGWWNSDVADQTRAAQSYTSEIVGWNPPENDIRYKLGVKGDPH